MYEEKKFACGRSLQTAWHSAVSMWDQSSSRPSLWCQLHVAPHTISSHDPPIVVDGLVVAGVVLVVVVGDVVVVDLVVVVGVVLAVVVDLVVVSGPGGQGQVLKSGEVGPLTQPSHLTRFI